mmetsp:Transcript_122895/g.309269  ORF Transcript_122895/g.309269 Transcript_122895/m.309269 type:complete len:263 (-) Transcript_122895:166-954(-)
MMPRCLIILLVGPAGTSMVREQQAHHMIMILVPGMVKGHEPVIIPSVQCSVRFDQAKYVGTLPPPRCRNQGRVTVNVPCLQVSTCLDQLNQDEVALLCACCHMHRRATTIIGSIRAGPCFDEGADHRMHCIVWQTQSVVCCHVQGSASLIVSKVHICQIPGKDVPHTVLGSEFCVIPQGDTSEHLPNASVYFADAIGLLLVRVCIPAYEAQDCCFVGLLRCICLFHICFHSLSPYTCWEAESKGLAIADLDLGRFAVPLRGM